MRAAAKVLTTARLILEAQLFLASEQQLSGMTWESQERCLDYVIHRKQGEYTRWAESHMLFRFN